MTPEPGEIVRDLLGDRASMECGCIVDRPLCFCLLCLKCESHFSCTDQERAAAHQDRLRSMMDRRPDFYALRAKWRQEWDMGKQKAGEMGVKVSMVEAMNANTLGGGFLHVGKKRAGRLLDGREWNEFPVAEKERAV
jgi:hypothetical protein